VVNVRLNEASLKHKALFFFFLPITANMPEWHADYAYDRGFQGVEFDERTMTTTWENWVSTEFGDLLLAA
jgi:hypothetical protein